MGPPGPPRERPGGGKSVIPVRVVRSPSSDPESGREKGDPGAPFDTILELFWEQKRDPGARRKIAQFRPGIETRKG